MVWLFLQSGRQNPNEDETVELQLPNFNENRQLKYLISELSQRKTHEDQAAVYLHYIKGCKFNTSHSPNGIIKFNDSEARSLAQWVINKAQNQPTQDIPQVCITVTVLLINDVSYIPGL